MTTEPPKPIYSTDHSSAVLRTHSWRNVVNSAAYLIPHLRPGMVILDVGCGPGTLTVDLAKRVSPGGKVIGIDYVPDPLEPARKLAEEQGVKNVEFRVGDIHALDFPDESFDIVHAHQVLQHIADPVLALREMRRVTKRGGGIVAVRESASVTWYPDSEAIADAWKLFRLVIEARGGNPQPGRYIHVWAREAGFERDSIVCTTGSWCFASKEEREYIGGSFGERMLSSGFTKVAIDGGYATKEDLERMAEGWRGLIEDENAWFAVLHGELICHK